MCGLAPHIAFCILLSLVLARTQSKLEKLKRREDDAKGLEAEVSGGDDADAGEDGLVIDDDDDDEEMA